MTCQRKIICGNVLNVLPKLGHFKCLIADPPDNIGLQYGSYDDSILRDDQYYELWELWIQLFVECSDIVWVSFNAKHVFAVSKIVENLYGCYTNPQCRLFIQSFTFGQNNCKDFGSGYRPILRIMRKGVDTYPDAVKIESYRQKHGDKRAAKGGKVPLDCWDEFPRITGNCKERRSWHPTQLREAMIKRMVDFSTKPGDRVCDAFSGTGTVLRAIDDRHITSIEIDPNYCNKIAEEHRLSVGTL